MSRYTFLLIIVFLQLTASGQNRAELIYGQWKEVKKTLTDGEPGRNVTFDGKDYEPSWNLLFETNGVCVDLENDFKLSFKLSDDKLRIGNSLYVVTEITSTKLVFTDCDPDDPENPLGFIHYFEKVK